MAAGDGLPNGRKATTCHHERHLLRFSLESCTDSLVDVIDASTAVTVSSNLLINHDKATLLRHKDAFFGERRVEMLKNIRGARNHQIMYVGHNTTREKYEVDVFHVASIRSCG
jgi:pectate lyase